MPILRLPDGRVIVVPDGAVAPTRSAPVQAPLPAPPQLPPQERIEKWLQYKASKYPTSTPPERAAQWQAYDRAQYEEHLGLSKKGKK